MFAAAAALRRVIGKSPITLTPSAVPPPSAGSAAGRSRPGHQPGSPAPKACAPESRAPRPLAACSLQLANGSTWPASGPARQTGLVWHGPVWGTGELPETVSKPVLDVVSLHSDADEHVVIPQRSLGVFPDQLPHERPVSPANDGISGVFRVCERLAKNLVLVQTLVVIV